jgi:hypothetical protein
MANKNKPGREKRKPKGFGVERRKQNKEWRKKVIAAMMGGHA